MKRSFLTLSLLLILFAGGVRGEPSTIVKELFFQEVTYMSLGLMKCREYFLKERSDFNCVYNYPKNRLMIFSSKFFDGKDAADSCPRVLMELSEDIWGHVAGYWEGVLENKTYLEGFYERGPTWLYSEEYAKKTFNGERERNLIVDKELKNILVYQIHLRDEKYRDAFYRLDEPGHTCTWTVASNPEEPSIKKQTINSFYQGIDK